MIAARVLRWAADKLDQTTAEVVVPDRSGPIRGAHSAIVTDQDYALRNEAALRLVDPGTLGYVVFRVHGDCRDANVSLDCQVSGESWPTVLSVMARTVLASDRVHSA